MKFYNHDELKTLPYKELERYRSEMLNRHAGNPTGSTSHSESNSILMAIEYEFNRRRNTQNEKEFQKNFFMNLVIIIISLISLAVTVFGLFLLRK
ncbi:MAG: hypothetical protein O3B87_02395 [bacterium]|nr:hypothetical protein [bacterium]